MTSRHCLLQRSLVKFSLGTGRLPFTAPTASKKKSSNSSGPWNMGSSAVCHHNHGPEIPISSHFLFLSPICAKTKPMSILHITIKPNYFLISCFLNPFIKLYNIYYVPIICQVLCPHTAYILVNL